MEQRPPPEVTIRDPARPDRPADVLVVGHDEPARSPSISRTRVTAVGAVLVLLAGVTGAAEVRERRDEAAAEQRLASVVDLRLAAGGTTASGSHDRQTDTARLELLLPVLNDGPRPVTVLSGGIAGYGLTRPVELPAGGRGLLQLDQDLDCSTLSGAPHQGETVELSVRTEGGVHPRRVELPMTIPFVHEHAQHICGFVPLDLAVALEILDIQQAPRTLQVTLEVTSTARRPIALVAVRTLAAGLEVTSPELADGRLALPSPIGEPFGGVQVRVDIRVVDCAAAAARSGGLEPLGLVVMVEDDRHGQALPQLDLDPSLRHALVDASC